MPSADHQLLQENLKFENQTSYKIPDLASALDKARLIKSCDPTNEYASWLSSPERLHSPGFYLLRWNNLRMEDADSFSKVVKDDIRII